MNTDEFFAEAKRLNLRVLGTPDETRAALDLKDAEIVRLTGMDDAKRAAGLVRVCVWLHPDDAAALREHAAKLAKRREKGKV